VTLFIAILLPAHCMVCLTVVRYKTPSEVAAEGRDDELDQQVSTLESIWNLRLQPGYDPQLTCMAHLWEVRL
jgi:hypothetical protein